MSRHFYIEGPALISFSGGRTSGMLLRRVLDEGLQPDVHVLFCNTGNEDERTLDFVRDCDEHWVQPAGSRIRWLEYRRRRLPVYKSEEVAAIAAAVRRSLGLEDYFGSPSVHLQEPGFVEVDYVTAARRKDQGSPTHPFTNLVCISGVPNAATRLCSTEMKTRVMKKFMLAQGYEAWTNVVGIRADEPKRVARMRVKPPERWENEVPLADADITQDDVMAFWKKQPFDLQLAHDLDLGTYEGNCDLCMLKTPAKKVRVAREQGLARIDWWETVEKVSRSFFRPAMPYREVRRLTILQTQSVAKLCPVPEGEELDGCMCHD